MVRVFVARVPSPNEETALDLPEGATVADALRRLALPLDGVVVIRRDVPIPGDAPLAKGDKLRVVNVFSGGYDEARHFQRPGRNRAASHAAARLP